MFDVLFSRAAWTWIGPQISFLLIPLILMIILLISDISKHLKANRRHHFPEQNNKKIAEIPESSDNEHSAFILPDNINISKEDIYEDTTLDIKGFIIKIFFIILLIVLLGSYLSDFSVENDTLFKGHTCPRTKIAYNKDAEKKLADSGIFANLSHDFFHIVDLPENVIEVLKEGKLLRVKYDPDKKFVLFDNIYNETTTSTCPAHRIGSQTLTTAKNQPDNLEYFSFSLLPPLNRTLILRSNKESDYCSREGEDNKIYYAKFDLIIEICHSICILDPQTNRVLLLAGLGKETVDLFQILLDYLKSNNL